MSVLPSTHTAAAALCGGSPAPVVRTRALHVVPEARTLPAVVGAGLRVPTLHGETAYEIGVRLVGSEMCIRDRFSTGHECQ